jgi:hypothetical protein
MSMGETRVEVKWMVEAGLDSARRPVEPTASPPVKSNKAKPPRTHCRVRATSPAPGGWAQGDGLTGLAEKPKVWAGHE